MLVENMSYFDALDQLNEEGLLKEAGNLVAIRTLYGENSEEYKAFLGELMENNKVKVC